MKKTTFPFRVVIDTREQLPWSFPPDVDCVRGALPTADYALEGDTLFGIERKSLNDFLGTISTGWDRFLREIKRMDGWRAKVVIVEGDFESCCFQEVDGKIVSPQHNHPRLLPQFICSRIAELTLMGVSVVFAGNPGQACALAYHILRKRAKELEIESTGKN